MTLQGYGQPPDWESTTYYPPGQTVISAGSIYRATNPLPGVAPPGAGWTLVVSGGGGGGLAPIVQDAAPIQGHNSDFEVTVSAPVSSGTFKLTFESVTTAALDGTTATMSDIADAMNTAYGSVIARAYPGSENNTPNDDGNVQFIGALGAAPTATPTVTDDTTDGGILTIDDQTGFPPTPTGGDGQFLIDTLNVRSYQYGPADNELTTATVWHRVWPVKTVESDNELSYLQLQDDGDIEYEAKSSDATFIRAQYLADIGKYYLVGVTDGKTVFTWKIGQSEVEFQRFNAAGDTVVGSLRMLDTGVLDYNDAIHAATLTLSDRTGTPATAAAFDSGGKVVEVAGADGTFTTADAKTVTVTKGIITSIV